MKQTQKKNQGKKAGKKPLLSKKGWLLSLLSLFLVVGLIIGSILLLTRPPVVYAFEGLKVRQNLYDYWTACYKYAYLISRKDLGIEDSPRGWQETDENGVTYQDMFYEEIEGAVRRRIVAAALFEKAGLSLSASDYKAIAGVVDGFGYYEEETPLQDLKQAYGVSKRNIIQIGVWEAEYTAYRAYLFGSDFSGVYADEYKDICQKRYEETCKRVRYIYIPESKPEEIAALEGALADEDLSEETFIALQNTYSEYITETLKNYPNGLYLCYALANPTQGFDDGLQKAITAVKQAGDRASESDEKGGGRWYVYCCALDEDGYRKNTIPGFAASVANEAYYSLLNEYTDDIVAGKGAPILLIADIKACREYNMVWELANK